MTEAADREVLWLRSPKERERPPSSHAVLWPAAEYTALIFGPAQQSDIHVDPFERAVLGAASNGLIEIKKQAELLNLNEGFVGHLQQCLRERGLLDAGGRLLGKADDLLLPQSHVAVRLYQDLLTGTLWPRFVTEQRRRTLPVETDGVRRTLMAGSTGRPVEIRAIVVRAPQSTPVAPTSDDAALAVHSWTRFRSRIRVGDFTIPQHGPIKLLPDSRQFVYLCCPNRRARPGHPDVDDPFGGPTWTPFFRALVEQSRPGLPLARWLYGPHAEDESPSVAVGDENLAVRVNDLIGRVGTASPAELAQLYVDLDEAGHAAVDLLWAAGTQDVETVLLDPESDRQLIDSACDAVGFDPAGLPVVADLRSTASESLGSLIDRCAALLLRYPADRSGPVHRLAARCPDLFSLLRQPADGRSRAGVTGLATAVVALTETTTDVGETTRDREAKHG